MTVVSNQLESDSMQTAIEYLEDLEDDDAESVSLDTVEVVTGVYHVVTLEKQAGRALNLETADVAMVEIIDANVSARKRQWSIGYESEPTVHMWENAKGKVERILTRYDRSGDKSNGWVYSIRLRVECKPKALRNTLGGEFDNIVAVIDAKAQLPKNRWRVAAIDGIPYIPRSIEAVAIDPNESIGYAPFELPSIAERNAAFSHLYGLEDYIEIIWRSIEAAVQSNWTQRVNVLLQGPPACGKSDLCKTLRKLLGEDAVLEFDATSTTMAGAQQMLAEREEMPRVLIIEEIEKAPEASLQWLLSVLDLRGEIRKTTARGSILKDVHMIGIATVNNMELFERLAAGALSSRFAMPLQFSRPTRDILWKILDREIRKIGGDPVWIEPALDFAEELDLTDPRKIIAITITGREKLLDKSYQRMILRTMGGTARRALTAHFESAS